MWNPLNLLGCRTAKEVPGAKDEGNDDDASEGLNSSFCLNSSFGPSSPKRANLKTTPVRNMDTREDKHPLHPPVVASNFNHTTSMVAPFQTSFAPTLVAPPSFRTEQPCFATQQPAHPSLGTLPSSLVGGPHCTVAGERLPMSFNFDELTWSLGDPTTADEYKPSSTVASVPVRRRIQETGKKPLLQEERREALSKAFAPLRDMASLSQSNTDDIIKLLESQLQELKASAPQSNSTGIGNPKLPARQKLKRNQGKVPSALGTKANKKSGKKQEQAKKQENKNEHNKIRGQGADGKQNWGN